MGGEKLIRASDARKAILNIDPKSAYCIDSIPAVDAVEVVRCRDCKKGHPELAPNGGVWCVKWNHIFCDAGFCSYGERR